MLGAPRLPLLAQLVECDAAPRMLLNPVFVAARCGTTRKLAFLILHELAHVSLGHTGLNWALRYLPAYVVNLTLLGEPIGATLIAFLLPGIREVPSALTLAGGTLVLAGILLALPRPARSRSAGGSD